MTDNPPNGFVRGNDRIARLLDKPGMGREVDAIRSDMDRMDRRYAEGLAEIRKASHLTQQQLAAQLGKDQGSVSRLERRDDMLLSTLAEYLRAAGAQNATLVASINGVEIHMPLEGLQKTD